MRELCVSDGAALVGEDRARAGDISNQLVDYRRLRRYARFIYTCKS